MNLSLGQESVKVGDKGILLKVNVVNNGAVPVEIVRFEVLGQWEPALKLISPPIIEETPGARSVEPQNYTELFFTFDAEQAGTAKLKVDVKMQVLTDPPLTDVKHSEVLEVSVVNP